MPKRGGPTRHLELERKFAVPCDVSLDSPGAGVAPSFEGLAAVAGVEKLPTQSLDAVYFDTADYALATRRVTLRRRTGGPDAGWHLKLPPASGSGTPQARTEVRAPLESGGAGAGASGPPEELLDVVRAIVRDRPLVPVARVATTRDVTVLRGPDGTALAEFCDDRVSAHTLEPGGDQVAAAEDRWREWELELTDVAVEDPAGLLDRLANRLADAGASPAAHGSKLARVLGAKVPPQTAPLADPVHRAVAGQIERLLEWDRGVRADAEDSVHQMRVATRQIRSLLQASENAFGLTDDAWILGELRELAAVLGVARDAEVLAARYHEALQALPANLVRGPVHDRLVGGARRRYEAGWRRSLSALRSERYFRLLDALDALVVASPPEPEGADSHPPATIASSYRRVRNATKAAKEAAETNRDDALHRIRKAAKRLRYVAAATGDVEVSERSKVIQSLLGDHQDSVVSRVHLLQQADAAHAAGEDTFTYGVLYQQETDLARERREQLDGALKTLRRSVRKSRRS